MNDYPTSDGKPMAETDWHRKLMTDLIETLEDHYTDQPRVYVSGNLLVFYEPGNRRRHVSPDVFMVRGVPKYDRPNYLIWEERRGPQVVIELTSSTTRREDQNTKYNLYQDTLKVREYFLFDPLGDYLKPPLQGYRLRQGRYHPIRAVQGRLPSQVLGLHLERAGNVLRLHDPATGTWLPTRPERTEQEAQARQQAEQARQQAEQARQQTEQARQQAEQARQQAEERAQLAETETERLRQQLADLERRLRGEE
jgi:Uma2 family endonuclease